MSKSIQNPISILDLTDDQLFELKARLGPKAFDKLVEAEESRSDEADKAEPEAAEPVGEAFQARQKAARLLDRRGLCDYAQALLGEMSPSMGASILLDALRDPKVPGWMKNLVRQVRETARGLAAQERQEALAAQPKWALELFAQFRKELGEVPSALRRSFNSGEGAVRKAGATASRFFYVPEGLPPLIKAFEPLMVANDGNAVFRLLVEDKHLAEAVAGAPEGRRGGALLNAMIARAKAIIASARRRQNGGAHGRGK